MGCGLRAVDLQERFDSGFGLGTGKSFEHCQSSGQAGIGKDPSELREKYHDQRLDLILIARCGITRVGYVPKFGAN
jgi:hypothetical protein